MTYTPLDWTTPYGKDAKHYESSDGRYFVAYHTVANGQVPDGWEDDYTPHEWYKMQLDGYTRHGRWEIGRILSDGSGEIIGMAPSKWDAFTVAGNDDYLRSM